MDGVKADLGQRGQQLCNIPVRVQQKRQVLSCHPTLDFSVNRERVLLIQLGIDKGTALKPHIVVDPDAIDPTRFQKDIDHLELELRDTLQKANEQLGTA